MVDERGPAGRRRHPLLRPILLLCGLLLLGWMFWHQRAAFSALLQSVRPGAFALAVGLGIGFTALQGMLLLPLFRKYGITTNAGLLLTAFLISQPGKYVPGKVWASVMQALVTGGLPGFAGIALANLELAVISMVQMTALGVACLLEESGAAALAVLTIGWLATTLMLRIPWGAIASRQCPRAWSRLGLPEVPQGVAPGAGRAGALSAASLLGNLIVSWSVLHAAGEALPKEMQPELLACLYLGFAASIPVAIVPAGLGVREAGAVAAGKWLASAIPTGLLTSVTLLARAWQLLVDLACFAVGVALLTRMRRLH